MGRGIKINCKRVYETGLNYNKEAEMVKQEQDKLNNISSEINNAWTGGDSHNFLVSFNEHIEALDEIIEFLDNNANILKRNALEHSNIDTNFTNDMKRSEIDDE